MQSSNIKQPTDYGAYVPYGNIGIVKFILIITQLLSLILIIWLIILASSSTSEINQTISEFQSTCFPTGTTIDPSGQLVDASGTVVGPAGFKQTFDSANVLSACDPGATPNPLGLFDRNFDWASRKDTWQTRSSESILYVIIYSNLLLLTSPYLSEIIISLINFVIWLFSAIIAAIQSGPQSYSKRLDNFYNKHVIAWETFVNTFPKNMTNKSSQEGGGLGSTLLGIVEKIDLAISGGDVKNKGEILRLFLSFNHIIFAIMLYLYISGQVTLISPLAFSFFIGIMAIFQILGNTIPDPNYSWAFLLIGIGCIVGYLILTYVPIFANENRNFSILGTISFCLIVIGIGLVIYGAGAQEGMYKNLTSGGNNSRDLDNFEKSNSNKSNFTDLLHEIIKKIGNNNFEEIGSVITKWNNTNSIASNKNEEKEIPIKKNEKKENIYEGGTYENKPSIVCLVFNFFHKMNNSLGFGWVKILLIAIGLLFNFQYDGADPIGTISSLHGAPLVYLCLTAALFIALYDALPIIGLCLKITTEESSDILPFYTIAESVNKDISICK